MKDFTPESASEIAEAIKDKTIIGCETSYGMDDLLIFYFSDATILRFRFDWIYEWEVGNVITELQEVLIEAKK